VQALCPARVIHARPVPYQVSGEVGKDVDNLVTVSPTMAAVALGDLQAPGVR